MAGDESGVDLVLLTTQPFEFPAQLARSLSDLGCVVAAVGPTGSPLLATSAVKAHHGLAHLGAAGRLAAALAEWEPALVVPCDDAATALVHALHASTKAPRIRSLIERSLGAPTHYARVRSRNAVLDLARSLGLPVPRTVVVHDEEEAAERAPEVGWPLVLKRDGGAGGAGVEVVGGPGALRGAWERLHRPHRVTRSVWRSARDRDLSPLRALASPGSPAVGLQSFVDGPQLTQAVACQEGRVVASATVEVISTLYPTGPATVVRPVRDSAPLPTAAALVEALEASGVVGFDYIVDPVTKRPLLLEMNPRATPISAIPLPEADVAAALAGLVGRRGEGRPGLDGTIALFPGELLREGGDPGRADHHLVPDDEPALVELCLRRAGRSPRVRRSPERR